MTPKRTDGNQATIAADLRRAGCKVFDTHALGHGFPDIVVAHAGTDWPDHTWLFEIKAQGNRARLTPDEAQFMTDWPGRIDIIRSAEDALAIMGLLKEAA